MFQARKCAFYRVEIGLTCYFLNDRNGDSKMSQPNTSNNQNQNTSSKPGKGGGAKTATIIGLAIIAILALGFAGYTAMNPHVSTVTQQQMITNTQSIFSTQTQTVTSINQVGQTVTAAGNQFVATAAATGVANQPSGGYSQYCSPYGCMNAPGSNYNTYNPYSPPNPWYPGYYNGLYYGYLNGYFTPPCGSSISGNNVTCSGYIFQAQNGCTVLVIPIANPYYSESYTFQYYSLHNLPSGAPSNGSWVTVSGSLYQGANSSSSGASCPGNYINVSSLH